MKVLDEIVEYEECVVGEYVGCVVVEYGEYEVVEAKDLTLN